jgi:hypothetical protein
MCLRSCERGFWRIVQKLHCQKLRGGDAAHFSPFFRLAESRIRISVLGTFYLFLSIFLTFLKK